MEEAEMDEIYLKHTEQIKEYLLGILLLIGGTFIVTAFLLAFTGLQEAAIGGAFSAAVSIGLTLLRVKALDKWYKTKQWREPR